jgi:hypothetical protein
MNDNTIQQTRMRAFRYYYEDGFVEMAMGLFFVVIGAVLWAYKQILEGTSWGWLLALLIMALAFGGAYAIKMLVGRLKSTITYPRTGKVTYREKAGNRGRWLLIAGSLLVTVALIWLPGWLNSVAFAEGAFLALILIYMGSNVGVGRMQFVGVVSVVVGVLAAYSGMADILGSALVFGCTGVLLAMAGIWALVRYLRNNPIRSDEES